MEYDFEELQLPGYGPGLLLYGMAFLVEDGEGFYVDSITLEGGKTILNPAASCMDFDAMLFRAIEGILYDLNTEEGMAALQAWADYQAGAGEPDSDYLYEQARDRREGF